MATSWTPWATWADPGESTAIPPLELRGAVAQLVCARRGGAGAVGDLLRAGSERHRAVGELVDAAGELVGAAGVADHAVGRR